jgi:hypothetical protein
MNNLNKKKKTNIKTSRPTNLSMLLFVTGSAALNISNIMIEDKYINIVAISISEIIIFIGMLLKNNEDNDKNDGELNNPINDIEDIIIQTSNIHSNSFRPDENNTYYNFLPPLMPSTTPNINDTNISLNTDTVTVQNNV